MPRRQTLALALAVALGGCGGGDAPAPPVAGDDGPQHIHGLGVNPADRSLIVATHTGLFRAGPAERRAERIGDRHQDTMGFTVVGRNEFLGSGHPDLRDDLPPLLGLIRSQDGGRSWQSISLLGEADFHVLRATGRRIYGFDATHGRLMVSGDGGRSWAERRPPAPLIDLAVDPDDADHVIASGEAALFASRDGGRTWRPVDRDRAGLLAWTDALHLVDGAGAVHRSRDGRRWRRIGSAGGQPAALAVDGRDLYLALHDNRVKVSNDGGPRWSVRVNP
jgi:hypothetical protein